jgi:hypothetical protein
MRQTLLKCDRCSFETRLNSWVESFNLYELPDGGQIPVPVRVEWCYKCKTLCATENLPDIACTRQGVREAKRVLLRCVARYLLLYLRYGGRMASNWMALARDQLKSTQALHRIVSNRKSPLRCLSCGSIDHKELPLSGFPEGKRSTLPIQHPGCDGHFVIDDRMGLYAEIQGPDRYFTPDGAFLRLEFELPRQFALDGESQSGMPQQSRFPSRWGAPP